MARCDCATGAGAHAGGTTAAEVQVLRVCTAVTGYDGWGAVSSDAEECAGGLA